jgi:hypothetical protein
MLFALRRYRWFVLILAVAAIAICADYARRCYGPPLSREEALHRGQLRLERFIKTHKVPGELPVLVSEQYEQDTRTWLLSYESKGCKVIVMVDRCHGDDIGGTSACGTQ